MRRSVVLPEGMPCPITGEPLKLVPDQNEHGRVFVYETASDRRWLYLLWENVFQHPTNGDLVYRWKKDKWKKQMKYYYETTLSSVVSVNSKWDDEPSTNFGAFWTWTKNKFYTTKVGLSILKAYRKLRPKRMLFPMIQRVHAKTVASDIVSVQPMAGPTSTLLYIEPVTDKISKPKISETKPDVHYTINKNNLTSNGKEDQRQI